MDNLSPVGFELLTFSFKSPTHIPLGHRRPQEKWKNIKNATKQKTAEKKVQIKWNGQDSLQDQPPGISKFHQNRNFHFEAGFGFSAPFCTTCAGYRPKIRSICHVTDIARKSWVPTYHGLYQQPMDVLENAGTCAKSYSAICDQSWKATTSSRTAQRHHSSRVLDTTTLSPRLGSLFSKYFRFFSFFYFFIFFLIVQAHLLDFRPYFRISRLIFRIQAYFRFFFQFFFLIFSDLICCFRPYFRISCFFLIFGLCWFTGIMPDVQCPRLHCTIRPSV